MSLPEKELERIGILASRVQDGEASQSEAAELARLRSEHPEIRELCAELELADGALHAAAGGAALPDGFAARVSWKALNEAPARPLAPGLAATNWVWPVAAAAGLAVTAALWAAFGGGEPASDDSGTVARQRDVGRESGATPRTPEQPGKADTWQWSDDGATDQPEPGTGPDGPPGRGPAPVQPRPPVPEAPPAAERPRATVDKPATADPQPTREAPGVPGPPAAGPVVLANIDALDAAQVSWQPGAAGRWQTLDAAASAKHSLAAGARVKATHGPVSLGLHQGGYVAMQRGAELGLAAADDGSATVAISEGRTFVDLDEGAALTIDGGVATVQLEPGARATLDRSDAGLAITVVDGEAEVRSGGERLRLQRSQSLRVSRAGRAGTPTAQRARLQPHERRFLAARFERASGKLLGDTPGWRQARESLMREARDLLGEGAPPGQVMGLMRHAAGERYGSADTLAVMRGFRRACEAGRDPRMAGHGLRRLLKRRARGRQLQSELDEWLRGDDRPQRPGTAPERPPAKPARPGKGPRGGGPRNKPGSKKQQQPKKQSARSSFHAGSRR